MPIHSQLATKELAYLAARAHGLTNKEVARQYNVSHRTVEGAMRRVLYKLEARKVAEAVYKATSEGLLCTVLFLAVFASTFQNQSEFTMRGTGARPRTTLSLRVKSGRPEYV